MTQMAAGKSNTSLPGWAVALVHVLFFFSGAAGLVYEVVWMRMLSFVFGNTTYAVSVVLATFLGGLAIGAWAYGRVADRRSDLLKVYGMLEVGAAAIALAMPFLLLGVLTPVYTWVYQRAGESAVALTVARLVLSGVVLVVPAVLLGGTLPVLVRFLVRQDSGMEAYIGRLYGLNTLGAVAGSFAAGFVFMPFLGMRWSNASGAAIGIVVGIAALLLHRRLGAGAGPAVGWKPRRQAAEGELLAGVPVGWLLGAFALSGFAALAYEVLWARLLAYYFEGFVYAFSAMLCVYLLGLALGSLAYSLILSRSCRPIRLFVILEVVIGMAAAATIPVFLMLQRVDAEGMKASFWGHTAWTFIAAAAIMLVPTMLIGAVFPLVCGVWARATGRVGSSVGGVYLVNTIGTVLGSLGAGFVLIPAAGTRAGLFLMGGLNVFAGLMVWAASGRRGWRRAVRGAAAVAAPAALVVAMNQGFTARDLAQVYAHGQAIAIEWVNEGIDGTVTIERPQRETDALYGMGTDRRLSVNGVNVAGTRFDFHTTQKLQAHLGLLVNPGAERVLQIGFGSGGTAYSASLHPVERIDCVEISKAVLSAAPRFEETNHGVLEDPRVHLYIEDARSFVKHSPHAYDVILSDSTHPALAGEGLLYSVDYLRDCADRLKPTGIFSTWLPVYSLSVEDTKVTVRSIREVFPYVYIWHTSIGRNEWCIVHGMKQPLAIDYDAFAGEMNLPAVADDLAMIGLSRPEQVLGLLLYDHRAVDRWVGDDGPLNTDDNGYLEFVGPRSALFARSRKLLWVLTFPDIALNAGGSVLDYVEGAGEADAPWMQRLQREEAANRLMLSGRLYEFARQDRYDILAYMAYRRALGLSPDHFVARTMLGISERQIDETREAALRQENRQVALDQLIAALTTTGQLAEAARWAAVMAEGQPPEPGPQMLIALLRGRWDEVERFAEEPDGSGRLMGVAISHYNRVVQKERTVVREAGDAERWLELGDLYRSLAQEIGANTQAFGGVLATLRLKGFRIRALTGLLEAARERYERALALSPESDAVRFRLAAVEASLGEYGRAIEVLEAVAASDDGSKAAEAELARLRKIERDPFAFLGEVQAQVLEHLGGDHG